MVGVDTTFLIDLFRGETDAVKLLDELRKKEEHVSTTVINLAELYRGAFLHRNAEKKLEDIEELRDLMIVLDMKAESAKYYGEIYANLKSRGRMARDRDLLIASVFLSFGEHRIVTQDKKHFNEIKGLEVITY